MKNPLVKRQATFDDPDPEYDMGYPYGEAGHAANGPFVDPDPFGDSAPVHTLYGYDHGFSGGDLADDVSREPTESVGVGKTNHNIDNRVRESEREIHRRQTSSTASKGTYGSNYFTAGGQPYCVIPARKSRRSITITNQSATAITCFIGEFRDVVVAAVGGENRPDVVFLPQGAARTFNHTDAIYVGGAAGGIIDWQEDFYAAGNG